ncbi:helix-turn-helix domain-containing protein [Cohnella sp. JJ-181]|uniref:helix-turn-helix domain-containing protein n=1 Tax=Cohnella rhizoplanae TaxID=2974897 RepID=UPI0022FF991C|nr:AraC family transcriptional regulator [Cohnella sp. JJ-181]CAI6052860.1 HTH-type transcriptional activator RhaS [Cohnella sp. JJ-181]
MGNISQITTDSIWFHHGLDRRRTDAYALHCHHFYEVYYFIEGEASYLVEGVKYVPEPHSLLLISPNVFHGVKVESDRPYERFAVHFEPSILSDEERPLLLSPFHDAAAPEDIYIADADRFGMRDYFEQLMACTGMSADIRDMALRIRLGALLSQLLHMRRTIRRAEGEQRPRQTVDRIIGYLNAHIAEDISLDALSALFFVSKHHLNKMFRRATGTTVGNYVIHKRVVLARQLMMQGETANAASLSAGFGHYSSFFRAYRNIYGHAPTERGDMALGRASYRIEGQDPASGGARHAVADS